MEDNENEENNHNNNIINNNQEKEGSQEEENLEENEDNKLMYIYEWVDSIPLSHQKNISRDFNDAVLLAEMIKFHYPRLVDLHNYPSASSTKAKLVNWETLNKKVLKKLGVKITKNEINDIINSRPNAIENLLGKLYHVIKGIPQESTNMKKSENFSQQNNSINNNNNALRNRPNNMNENNMENNVDNELITAINEKDQEIANLKEYIETLEQKIKISNEKQTQLELKIKELNSLLLQ